MLELSKGTVTKRIQYVTRALFLLIIFQLLVILISIALFRTMRTLSNGESLWSKNYLHASQNIIHYLTTRDEEYFKNYQSLYFRLVNFQKGRELGLEPQNKASEVIEKFEEAGLKEEDLFLSVLILPKLMSFSSVSALIGYWKKSEGLLDTTNEIAQNIHQDFQQGRRYTDQEEKDLIKKIKLIHDNHFNSENKFSDYLASLSRKIEKFIGVFLLSLLAVIAITTFFVTRLLVKRYKQSIQDIKKMIDHATEGDLSIALELKPENDGDSLTFYLQKMFNSFKAQLEGRANAEEAEARLAILGNAMPHMVCIKKPNNVPEFLNQKVWDYFDYGHRDPSQVLIYDHCHPDDYQKAFDTYMEAINNKTTSVCEIRLKSKNGSYHWFLSRFEPALDEKGDIVRWYGSFTDIQAQKDTEKELAKAIKIRDQFLSMASHELKTPLTSLKLRSEIKRRILSKEEYEKFSPEYLTKSTKDDVNQIDRIVKLVDEMLDISRIAQGRLSLDKSEFKLSDLINDVTERFSSEVDSYGTKVKVDVSNDIRVNWDLFKMDQVLSNLITNALKYGNRSEIIVGTREKEGKKQVFVKDHGPGIKKEDHQKIFELFERVTTDSSIGGMGLGLYISKNIVEAHGSNIFVESEEGKGTTFVIDL